MAWTLHNDNPALACPAPLIPRAGFGQADLEDWLRRRSPDLPSVLAELAQSVTANLPSAHTSAFTFVAPTVTPTPCLTPVLHPGFAAMPALLNRIGGNTILRSSLTTPLKPIPNNDRVDLVRFRVKEPCEWRVEDIVSFLFDIAKRYAIPYEDMNMHRISSVSGQQLICMSEKEFLERDPQYGSLIFKELKKMLSEDSLIDNIMRKYNSEEEESGNSINSSAFAFDPLAISVIQQQSSFMSSVKPTALVQPMQSIDERIPTTSTDSSYSLFQSHGLQASTSGCMPSTSVADRVASVENKKLSYSAHDSAKAVVAAVLNKNAMDAMSVINHSGLSMNQAQSAALHQLGVAFTAGIGVNNLNRVQSNANSSSTPNAPHLQPQINQLPANNLDRNPYAESYKAKSIKKETGAIKINKDGRPRKRSQHTKGNKLWEFIKDALTDPETCPSVVRWEDPIQGVFRIVESEKLARLWGERKKNNKMTYEKLSRAMRTYYEKQILVPVPKTGIYPKKLVYKFGPGAYKNELSNM